MRFLIITHVEHQVNGDAISAYGPYVREMNLWLKHVDEVVLVAPKNYKSKSLIDLSYNHDNLNFKPIPSIEFTSAKKAFFSVFRIPVILYSIFKACQKTDHIHLRCPGNIGLLGCLVQIFFPKKIKTAKYAGNWDPDAVQPLSYKFQKWLLSNTFLTKNMTVLVYGNWKNQTKNIKSFFTATYHDDEIEIPKIRDYSNALNFVFVGGLVEGKRPLFAIQIVQKLNELGYDAFLSVYGDGVLKTSLQSYISENGLGSKVKLFGNQEKKTVKESLKASHFLILPSKSEGWPKAIAEAMFFGVIPIATSVSCVPHMSDNGNRGVLIASDIESAIITIKECLRDFKRLKSISFEASKWSQTYTLDYFETEIIKLLKA